MIMHRVHSLFVAGAALLPMLGAEPVQMKAARVALFKNGYACVEMQGSLRGGRQRQVVLGMPQPVFGTFSWASPAGVARVDSHQREVEVPSVVTGVAELLRINEGKSVTIELKGGRVYQGVLALPQVGEAPVGAFADSEEAAPAPGYVLLHTFRGDMVSVGAHEIIGIDFAVGEAPNLPSQKVSVTELEVDLAQEPEDGTPLTLSCLAHGLSWLPTYTLNMGEEDKGEISLKATVINDLVDLENVQLELVSGSPSLGTPLIESPLTQLLGIKDFLKILDSTKMQEEMASGSLGNYAPPQAAETAARDHVNRVEELFCYSIPAFSCPRGETLIRKLFSQPVSYRHVYTCTLPSQGVMKRFIRSGKPVAEVWHCLRLTNEGTEPWSSGIITCYSGGRFVSRSVLPFTAPGQESLLRLNQTYECTVHCSEQAAKPDKETPEKMLYEGSITICNTSAKPIELELSKEIIGTPQAIGEGGACSTLPGYGDNPIATCSWKLHLEPGEEKTCTYSYEFFNN